MFSFWNIVILKHFYFETSLLKNVVVLNGRNIKTFFILERFDFKTS